MTTQVQLGLIGSQISHSLAPRFHELAGLHSGLNVSYELIQLEPDQEGDLSDVLARLRDRGFRGVNVTYPFKQRVLDFVDRLEKDISDLGAVNTVVFDDGATHGYNTDYSGLVNRWVGAGRDQPGQVALLGAGGVGRAAAFAFAALGADQLRVVDPEKSRARDLVAALSSSYPDLAVDLVDSQTDAVAGADGVFNATPVGMYFNPGSPVDLSAIVDQRWVYDAIYAPVRTPLIIRAEQMGILTLDGFELFIGQGIDAYSKFIGTPLPVEISRQVERTLRPIVEQLVDGD
ncbi:MAG TPA: shikimate dehydrogenase [Acidimicrobiia bacterium]